jgi:phosphoglycolate phosphatase
VSNKAQQLTERLMSQLGLAVFFDCIQGALPALAPKPAPDMLIAALAKLEAKPRESMFIGDSRIDVAAGNAAGLPVIFLEGSYTAGVPLPEGAFHVFQGFHAFAHWIEGMDALT